MSLLPDFAEPAGQSVFAGADIAATARLAWRDGYPRPRFEGCQNLLSWWVCSVESRHQWRAI